MHLGVGRLCRPVSVLHGVCLVELCSADSRNSIQVFEIRHSWSCWEAVQCEYPSHRQILRARAHNAETLRYSTRPFVWLLEDRYEESETYCIQPLACPSRSDKRFLTSWHFQTTQKQGTISAAVHNQAHCSGVQPMCRTVVLLCRGSGRRSASRGQQIYLAFYRFRFSAW